MGRPGMRFWRMRTKMGRSAPPPFTSRGSVGAPPLSTRFFWRCVTSAKEALSIYVATQESCEREEPREESCWMRRACRQHRFTCRRRRSQRSSIDTSEYQIARAPDILPSPEGRGAQTHPRDGQRAAWQHQPKLRGRPRPLCGGFWGSGRGSYS